MDVLNRPAFSTANQIKRNPIISLRASTFSFFFFPPDRLFSCLKRMRVQIYFIIGLVLNCSLFLPYPKLQDYQVIIHN